MEKVKFKMIGVFDNHTVKRNGNVDLRMKFPYSELPNYLNLFKILNQNTTLIAKVGGKRPIKLGIFTVSGFKVDRDGEATVTFNSEIPYVEYGHIIEISETNGTGERVALRCEASIEIEEEVDDE